MSQECEIWQWCVTTNKLLDIKQINTMAASSCKHSLESLVHVARRGWLGEAKVLSILNHRGIQLRLAYSWARLAILAVGKGRGRMFLLLLFLFHSFSSCSPVLLVSSPILSLLFIFSLSMGDNTKWPTRVDVLLNPTQSNHAARLLMSRLVWVFTINSLHHYWLSFLHEKIHSGTCTYQRVLQQTSNVLGGFFYQVLSCTHKNEGTPFMMYFRVQL